MDAYRAALDADGGQRDPIAVLRATPLQVEALLADPRFDPDRRADDDGPGRSPRAWLARLADREIVFAHRARQAVAATHRPERGPHRAPPDDAPGWERAYGRMDPSLAVAAFGGLRAWNLAWLARLDLADWWAPSLDEDGHDEVSVDELVRALARHDVLALARLAGSVTGRR
jgi:hypothetical protein